MKGDEAELFDRYENRANEEVLLREKELESFKPKFTQQEAVEESILQEVSLKNQGTYVQFREIKLIGGDMLSEREKDRLVKPYLNKSIRLRELDELVSGILQWYFDRGFNTTRVGFKEESFRERGVLKIYVVEGKVG